MGVDCPFVPSGSKDRTDQFGFVRRSAIPSLVKFEVDKNMRHECAKQFCQKVLRRDLPNWGLAQKLAIVLLVGTGQYESNCIKKWVFVT